MRFPFGVRKKLLVAVAGPLVLASALLFALQLREAHMLRTEITAVVEDVIGRLQDEPLPGGPTASPSPLLDGEDSTGAPRVHEWRVNRFWSVDPDGIQLRIEREMLWLGEDPDDLLPPLRHTVIPPEAAEAVLLRFRDPIQSVRSDSLPRQFGIAGLVLLVSVVLVWLLAGRLIRPLQNLTAKMGAVAAGDLRVRVTPTTHDEVGQMALSFNTMVERLREKRDLEHRMVQAERLSVLGTLAASVAHDVRNPLNTIGLTLDHLRDTYGPVEPERAAGFQRLIDDVRAELHRLNELVRSFLSLAHPDRGSRVECHLDDLLETSLRLFRKEAEQKQIDVIARLDKVGELDLNPHQVRRAVTNILLNALQAVPESRGEISVSLFRRAATEDGSFARESRPGEVSEEIVVRISDNGPGMEPSQLERVFQPYYTTNPDGTGLGLPIAQWAVEANGGRIELRSERGRGTDVELVFPARGSSEDPDKPNNTVAPTSMTPSATEEAS